MMILIIFITGEIRQFCSVIFYKIDFHFLFSLKNEEFLNINC